MTATTVHVSNISSTATESEVSSFFSFCGKINSLTLTPVSGTADSLKSATITFTSAAAASTAVLLDGTPLNDTPLRVEVAHNIDEMAGPHLAASADIGPDGEIPQDAKPRSAILAEYLASGYVISDSALQRGIELDRKHQLTTKFTSYLTSALSTIDSKLHASDRAKSADSQFQIRKKALDAQHGLMRYFESAIGTPLGKKVRDFYMTGEKQVMDIHTEAKRLAELKKEKRRSRSQSVEMYKCTCEGAEQDGTCKCEAGKCDCEGCREKSEVAAAPTAEPVQPVQSEKSSYA